MSGFWTILMAFLGGAGLVFGVRWWLARRPCSPVLTDHAPTAPIPVEHPFRPALESLTGLGFTLCALAPVLLDDAPGSLRDLIGFTITLGSVSLLLIRRLKIADPRSSESDTC